MGLFSLKKSASPASASSSEKPLVVFFHIPKTAGTAVYEIIRANVAEDKFFSYKSPLELSFISDETLNSYDVIGGHAGFGILERIHRPVYAFTFLRDPVERTLSLYYYWKGLVDSNSPGPAFIRDMSLEDFVKSDFPMIQASVDNTQSWFLAKDLIMFFREYEPLEDDALFERAENNAKQLDLIGFQENFKEDVERLVTDLGWNMPASLDKPVNKTKERKAMDDVDPKLIELIRARVKVDQQLYDSMRALRLSKAA